MTIFSNLFKFKKFKQIWIELKKIIVEVQTDDQSPIVKKQTFIIARKMPRTKINKLKLTNQ